MLYGDVCSLGLYLLFMYSIIVHICLIVHTYEHVIHGLLRHIGRESIREEELVVYCAHLKAASQDMETIFADLLSLDVPQWAFNPFKCDITTVNSNLQEQLIDLTCDLEAQTINISSVTSCSGSTTNSLSVIKNHVLQSGC